MRKWLIRFRRLSVRLFCEALSKFSDWWGEPEPEVSFECKSYSISTICGFAMEFGDPLPESVYVELLSQMDAHYQNLKEDLSKDRSYKMGARCLLRLIDDRKEEYRRRDEQQRR
jgi:hypothetical protein